MEITFCYLVLYILYLVEEVCTNNLIIIIKIQNDFFLEKIKLYYIQ